MKGCKVPIKTLFRDVFEHMFGIYAQKTLNGSVHNVKS